MEPINILEAKNQDELREWLENGITAQRLAPRLKKSLWSRSLLLLFIRFFLIRIWIYITWAQMSFTPGHHGIQNRNKTFPQFT
jgi:hypothetical protein